MDATGHRSLPPQPFAPTIRYARATHSYKQQDVDDLSFRKGDRLEILEAEENSNWWLTRHLRSGQTGYVPKNHVKAEEPEIHDDHDSPAQDSPAQQDNPAWEIPAHQDTPAQAPEETTSEKEVDPDAQTQVSQADELVKASQPLFVRVIHNYTSQHEDDLSVKQGDRLSIFGDSEDDTWWYGVHETTGEQGYVPSNYVTCQDPDTMEWWFDVGRDTAEAMLLSEGNPKGTFLVRPSSQGGNYALSLRGLDKVNSQPVVKHYAVVVLRNGICSINKTRKFSNMVELVKHYSKVEDERLVNQLVKPCPRGLDHLTPGNTQGDGHFGRHHQDNSISDRTEVTWM